MRKMVPMNNLNTKEILTNVALGFVNETLILKLPVNKSIFVATPRCVLGVLYCIFTYIHSFLLLDLTVDDALKNIGTRCEELALSFPNNIVEKSL
jgi:hypothetical protein